MKSTTAVKVTKSPSGKFHRTELCTKTCRHTSEDSAIRCAEAKGAVTPDEVDQIPTMDPAVVDGKLTFGTKLSKTLIQATRTEGPREVIQWILFTTVGTVSCKDIEQCREVAARFGAVIAL